MGTVPPLAPLDGFLDGFSITSTSASWSQIIHNGPLQLVVLAPPAAQEIAVKSSFLWDLTFSSQGNTSRFGPSPPSLADAAVSPDTKDAVLGLAPLVTPPTRSFADVRTKFIGTAAVSPQLTAFVNTVDPAGSMTLALDAATDNRNALWAVSADAYRTIVLLIFEAPASALNNIQGFISDAFGIALNLLSPKGRLIFRLITSYVPNPTNPALLSSSSSYQIDVSLNTSNFEITASFTPSGLDLILSNPLGAPPPTQSIFGRLSGAILGPTPSGSAPKAGDLPSPGQGGAFNSLFSGIGLWYISLQPSIDRTQLPDGTVDETSGPVFWQINIIADWHTQVDVFLALQYDSRLESFYGRLLFSGDATPLFAARRFDYDWQLDVSTALSRPLPPNVDIWQLFNPSAKAPPQIPSKIIHGSTSFTKASGNGFTFTLAATIVSDAALTPPAKSAKSAPDGFVWDVVSVATLVQNLPSGSLTSIELFSEFTLNPKPGSTFPPASFSIDIKWSSAGSWLLHGFAGDLSLGLLSDFFDSEVRDSAMGLLGSLTMQSLDVVYTYDASGEASSFFIGGVIVLGELELDLAYEYASGLLDAGVDSASTIARNESGTAANSLPPLLGPVVGGTRQSVWTFTATLGATSPSSTIRSIVSSLSPNAARLPDFVGDIPVGAASGPQSAVKLILRGEGGYTALSIAITIGDFSFTFVSLNSPSSPAAKRILRVEVDQIPLIKSIPLIKELPQPFDKLLYLWLDDGSGKGLLKPELDNINAELDFLAIPRVLTKDTNNADPSLAVLQPGHHFMVINKGTVVLDHNFSDSAANSTPTGPAAATTAALVPLASTSSTSSDGGPTKGGLQVQLPFLTISGIALDYKQGSILLEFDAAIKLGPLEFALIGFFIGIPLSSIHLDDLSNIQVNFGLHGLEVAVNEAPVTLAGVFIHDGIVNFGSLQLDTYRGGISLGFEAWKFIAVGEYASSVSGNFKSVFVYAKLDGPLITLAFATVSGVRVGLGYNSVVRSPTLKELPSFPFLDDSVDSSTGQDPLALLNRITNPPSGTPWVTPKEDSYWLAAGLTLTAFGILSVTAVLMFGVRDGGYVISVFADGIAQIPPDAPAESTLFYVEIDMLAELNTVDGYFTVQAALAPSSHVLISSCRLTGGFALVNWFSPNAHSGDFVFTVGGFHRAYSPPAWYPVPDRLGISFTLGSMINVTGNVYFAITPKCVMGGGALHLGLDVGPVSAWLDVALDVFIQFKPFHYTADLMISVGCAISIDVWFVHIRISASVGAALHIEGPDPFGGSANVDFYLFSFTINFGDRPTPPPAATLPDFYKMANIPGPDPAPSTAPNPVDPMMARIKFTVSTGLYPQPLPPLSGAPPPSGPFPSAGAGTPWNIKTGTFSCIIGVDFALSAATITNLTNPSGTPILTPGTNTNPPNFFSKPMHISAPFVSTLIISVYSIDSSNNNTVKDGFTGEMVLKDVPAALWGAYSQDDDPSVPGNSNPQHLKDGSDPTVKLCMGVTLNAPPSNFGPSPLQDFDPSVAFRASIGSYSLPDIEGPQKTFTASTPIHASETPAERWAGFENDWNIFGAKGKALLGSPAADGTQPEGMLKLAAHWLAWDAPPPSQDKPIVAVPGQKLPWVLDGSLPQILLGSLGNEYPVLPRYSADVP